MRRAARVDSNQAEIVSALRTAGAMVQSLASVGGGVPDILVGYAGRLVLIEIKNMSGRGDGLTPAEQAWHDAWAGMPVYVARNTIEALGAVGVEWSA